MLSSADQQTSQSSACKRGLMSDTEGSELDPLVAKKQPPPAPIGHLQSLPLDRDGPEKVSVQELLDRERFNRYDALYLIALGMVAMAESLQLAYIAIVLPFLTCEWNLGSTKVAFVSSLTFTASGIGSILLGPLSDKYGRRLLAIVTNLLICLSTLICGVSTSYWIFLPAAMFSGFNYGGTLSIAFTFWAEISSIHYRSAGVSVMTMLWCAGMTLANVIGLIFLNGFGWRLFSFTIAIPALIPALILFFLPDSPKFLNGQNDEAKVIQALSFKTMRPEKDFDCFIIAPEDGDLQFSEDNFSNEEQRSFTEKKLWHSFLLICSPELRADTFKVLFLNSCLQTVFKSIIFVYTKMLVTNYCGVEGLMIHARDEAECVTLTDKDFINSILLSLVLYLGTAAAFVSSRIMGQLDSAKIFSFFATVSNILLFICMPILLIYFLVGFFVFNLSSMSLIVFMILPQLYPTLARNSGFGLIDGGGKIVASIVLFVIVALLDYSIPAALAMLVVVSTALFLHVLFSNLQHNVEIEPM